MNLLTAILIYSLIFNRVGVPDCNPCAGFFGDAEIVPRRRLVSSRMIFLSAEMVKPIRSYDELRIIVDANDDKPVNFLVDRHGQQIELTAIPRDE